MELPNNKDQLKKFLEEKSWFEKRHAKLLKTSDEYRHLSDHQRDLLKADWESYYKQIDESKAYRRYFKMKELWKQGRTAEVKEFALKAHEQIESQAWELPKPAMADPLWIESNQLINRYRYICRKIEDLQKGKEDYAVFGF